MMKTMANLKKKLGMKTDLLGMKTNLLTSTDTAFYDCG